jgi:response regulator RpfG family c-di-GMP phosphodiesterase
MNATAPLHRRQYEPREACLIVGHVLDSLADRPETDLRAVGVQLYELLTGQSPSPEGPLARPSLLNPKIPAAIELVVLKALAADPAKRFQSSVEFRDSLILASARPDQTAGAARLAKAARVLSEAKTSPAPAEDPDAKEEKRPRVLFVDDDDRILTGLRSLFRHDFQVTTAPSAALALEYLSRFDFHVVVSDQRMPEMTGLQLLKKVHEISPRSMRVLLTGYADLAATVDAVNEGEVFRFVKKPWDNEDLIRTVADAAAIGVELANSPEPRAELPDHVNASIVVIDQGTDITHVLRQFFGDYCTVQRVTNSVDAVRIIEKEPVALIVGDLSQGQEEMITLAKLLKFEHPQILAMLLADAADSEMVIDLINQAQVFRFLSRPFKLRQLRDHVEAALVKFVAFRESPALLKEHAVKPEETLSALGQAMQMRLRAIRDRQA